MAELIPPGLAMLDRVALSWFLLAWLGYGLAIHALPWRGSITAGMGDVRRAWMCMMLARDNRITDASRLGHTPGAAAQGSLALPVAAVLSLAIRSFNAGIRGGLFALAVLAWLLGPAAFLVAATGMVLMLLWRQFGSATAVAIRHSHAALLGIRPAPRPAVHRSGAHSAAGVNGSGWAAALRMQP